LKLRKTEIDIAQAISQKIEPNAFKQNVFSKQGV